MFSIKKVITAGSFLMLAGVVACGQIPSGSQNGNDDAQEQAPARPRCPGGGARIRHAYFAAVISALASIPRL